jgi:hypothetical protein
LQPARAKAKTSKYFITSLRFLDVTTITNGQEIPYGMASNSWSG